MATKGISAAIAWVASTAYSVGNIRRNDTAGYATRGRSYQCTVAGTSAGSGGPTGTGASIVDGGVTWKWLQNVDYILLEDWCAYVSALGTLSAPEIGNIDNGAEFVLTTQCQIVTVVPSSTNTVTLQPLAGQGWKDHATVQTNAGRYDQSKGVGLRTTGNVNMLRLTSPWITAQGLQFYSNQASDQGTCIYGDVAATNCTVRNNIFYGRTSSGNAHVSLTGNAGAIQNNLVVVTSGNSNGIDASGGTGPTVAGNVIANTGGGTGKGIIINAGGGNGAIVRNNAVLGFGANDYFGTAAATSSNNASDQAAFGGTDYNIGGGGQFSLVGTTEFYSVTNLSEDFRLKGTTSVKLLNNGATIAALSPDAAGTTRPQGAAYDIGWWEYVAAATAAIRRYSSLSGLGAVGPFFNDPL